MSDFIVRIDDKELVNYIRLLQGVNARVLTASGRWVRRLAEKAETSMKLYSRAKSARGTGKLSSSITTEYSIKGNSVGASVFVPSSIKYQYAAEYGFKRKFTIKGQPRMTFPESSWGNAVKIPSKGYFVFTTVVRGRYKGKSFTAKAFKTTLKMYNSNKSKILNEVGNIILFSRS